MPYIEYNKFNTLPEQVEENRINILNEVKISDNALNIGEKNKEEISQINNNINSINNNISSINSDIDSINSNVVEINNKYDAQEAVINILSNNVYRLETQLFGTGSIYISTNSTSPASVVGGVWELIKDRFLLGSGDNYSAGTTGGTSIVILTSDNLPNILNVGQNKSGVEKWISGIPWTNQAYENEAWIVTQKSILNDVGNTYVYNQPHNNMPPYLAVYIWKRIQ